MKITEFMQNSITLLDGGMGTLLQAAGLAPGQPPEKWNITRPEEIVKVHTAYFNAGSNVVNTNTFGANVLKFAPDALEEIIKRALENARKAADASTGGQPKFIALDVGPTGRLLQPLGDLPFERAVEVFAETVRLGVKYGADLIFIETMTDLYETKAALLAAKENSDLPVFVSNAYTETGRLMTGAPPEAVIATLEGMGANAVGVNCSLGPKALRGVINAYLANASPPVLFKPNAGLPTVKDGRTVYDVLPADFADEMRLAVTNGVRLAGGCCGTAPEYIAALRQALENVAPVPVTPKTKTVAASWRGTVSFGGAPLLIGERLNPTGKKRLKQALKEHDVTYVLDEGAAQEEAGAQILDVNAGLPEIDEKTLLPELIAELQTVTDLPLQIDTADAAALERSMRIYNGKPMVNSVNGKRESMAAVFPLIKKYGGVLVALTLDENGIPPTAQGRLEIAERILNEALRFGLQKKDLVFDPLCMTVSTSPEAANVVLEALRLIREKLGCQTVIGLSNVSFGLPNRDALNGTFFTLAAQAGLGAAIVNPFSAEIQKAYYTYRALTNLDENFTQYIERAAAFTSAAAPAPEASSAAAPAGNGSPLRRAIEGGMKANAAALAETMLRDTPAIRIIEDEIVPALDAVGEGYEKQRLFLPQLLNSAEAAGAAFEVIRAHASAQAQPAAKKCRILIATVQGDVHDIGKNIVKLLLQNYGYEVTDLGKDVSPARIAEAAAETGAPLVGLSALMTTTVPAMAETIRLLREKAPGCKVMVGGAVLTEGYAASIGADYYGRDAMATVRIAEQLTGNG